MSAGVAVTFVGTGTALPDAERGPTCTLIADGDARVAVDLGSGALQKLAAEDASVDRLDALLLTHAHLDHVADVLPLLFALSALPVPRRAPLEIICSAPTRAVLADAQAAFRTWLTPPDERVVWRVVEPGEPVCVAGIDVTVGHVDHSDTSVGYRLHTSAGDIAVPGDSGPCEGLDALLRGVRLAVLECSTDDAIPVEGHLTPSTFVDAVQRAAPEAVALVHRYASGPNAYGVQQIDAAVDARVWAPEDRERIAL